MKKRLFFFALYQKKISSNKYLQMYLQMHEEIFRVKEKEQENPCPFPMSSTSLNGKSIEVVSTAKIDDRALKRTVSGPILTMRDPGSCQQWLLPTESSPPEDSEKDGSTAKDSYLHLVRTVSCPLVVLRR